MLTRRRRPTLLLLLGTIALVPTAAARELPARWDWRDLGMVTPAREYGFCNATWCFAAVAAVESMLLIHEGRETDLSEQQILACVTPGAGCHGGWMDQAYRFIRDLGVAEEGCFPYNGDERVRCDDYACPPAATIADWIDVANDLASLKAAVLEGPVTTVMRMPVEFYSYDGSTCIPAGGERMPDDVGVTLIGWDDTLCDTGGWIAKACFGPEWGENGCFTIAYGAFGIGEHAQRPLPSDGRWLRASLLATYDGSAGSVGDGDTWPEPGETVLLALGLRNGPLAATRLDLSVRVTRLSGPGALAPTDATVGLLAPGARAELQPLLPLAVDRAAAPGDTIRLACAFTVGGAAAGADTVAIALGAPSVLVVDDDEGEFLEKWAIQSARRVGYPVRVWEESRRGPVNAEELRRYRAVLWHEGVLGRLGRDNIGTLSQFLEGGGRLFISGQDIGWWLADLGTYDMLAFYETYLQADYLADVGIATAVHGIPGDPLGDGLAFTLGGPGGSGRQASPDLIAPRPGALPICAYADGGTAALRSEAHGRLVYCAFGIEGIDQGAARDSLLSRALGWLAGPPPDVSPPRVELLAPHGGETFAPGSVQTARWRGRDDRGVVVYRVERSRDDGATWPELLGWVAPTDSTFAWAVGDSTGERQRIRVLAADVSGLWGAAVSGPFRVGAPAAAVSGALAAQPLGEGARVELAANLSETAGLAVERRVGTDGPARGWAEAEFASITRTPDGVRAVVVDGEPVGWPRTYTLLLRTDAGEIVLDRLTLDGSAPTALRVDAWPNPFNPRLAIRVALTRAGRASLTVYDARGRLVRTLLTGDLPAGGSLLTWDGADDAGHPLASGVYQLRLRDEAALATRRATLLR